MLPGDERSPHLAALTAFVLVTFTFSWVLYGTAPRAGLPLAGGMRVLSGFGPSLAAVAVAASTGGLDGVRRLLAPLTRWRLPWRWYVGSLSGPPLAMGAGVGLYLALGGSVGPSENDPGMWWPSH